MDKDAAGRRATARLLNDMADTDCEYLVWSGLYGKYKDANEFLIKERDAFSLAVENFMNAIA